jgi:hypothetical protein
MILDDMILDMVLDMVLDDEKRTSYKRIYTNNRPSQLSMSNAIIGKV